MATSKKDPTAPIRLRTSRYPGVDEGTACTQSSFKTSKRAFLFVGMQGGRFKAMFKLKNSIPEAANLAKKDPDRFSVQTQQLGASAGPRPRPGAAPEAVEEGQGGADESPRVLHGDGVAGRWHVYPLGSRKRRFDGVEAAEDVGMVELAGDQEQRRGDLAEALEHRRIRLAGQ